MPYVAVRVKKLGAPEAPLYQQHYQVEVVENGRQLTFGSGGSGDRDVVAALVAHAREFAQQDKAEFQLQNETDLVL